jgi:hypothetical protein
LDGRIESDEFGLNPIFTTGCPDTEEEGDVFGDGSRNGFGRLVG